ncbi:MAG: phytanoyl-CoA dioxygenase family protein [Planctomycetes bacterium]|nr:phytanoyl-CoA dioxygenase family protein [Planctomycetota bacterium]
MHLTPQQKRHFETFGFVALPGLLGDRSAEISDAFEELWSRQGGGHFGQPHDGQRRSCLAPFIDHSERLSTLLDDARIRGIAQSLVGDDFNYMGSDGNFYVGDTGWHSDGWHASVLHIKIAFYLDPLTRDTGCLRVIPGSHRVGDGYAEQLQRSQGAWEELFGIHGRDIPAQALETKPGDILVFNHNTKHAAFGGNSRRRMFTMNLCQRYPEANLQELRDYMSGGARFWVERAYGPAMLATATPERMRHLEQCLANDGHLKELARAARERMAEPARG